MTVLWGMPIQTFQCESSRSRRSIVCLDDCPKAIPESVMKMTRNFIRRGEGKELVAKVVATIAKFPGWRESFLLSKREGRCLGNSRDRFALPGKGSRSCREKVEGAEEALSEEGVAEKDPGRNGELGESDSECLDPGGEGLACVEGVGDPAQGVCDKIKDQGTGERAEEDLPGLGVFEEPGQGNHGGEANYGNEHLGGPIVALGGVGGPVADEPGDSGENEATPSKKDHAAEEEGAEGLEINERVGCHRAKNTGDAENDDKDDEGKCALHGLFLAEDRGI